MHHQFSLGLEPMVCNAMQCSGPTETPPPAKAFSSSAADYVLYDIPSGYTRQFYQPTSFISFDCVTILPRRPAQYDMYHTSVIYM